MLNCIRYIEPIHDRIMEITLGHAMEITLIHDYTPTADKDEEETTTLYDEVENNTLVMQRKDQQ